MIGMLIWIATCIIAIFVIAIVVIIFDYIALFSGGDMTSPWLNETFPINWDELNTLA